MVFTTHNPATGDELATYPETSAAEATTLAEQAHAAFSHWRQQDFDQRAAMMLRIAYLIEHNPEPLARMAALEIGKPYEEAKSEVLKCAWAARFGAAAAKSYLADEPVPTEAKDSFIHYEPLGVILTITPWNFPFYQIFRSLVPMLMAGNTALIKPSPETIGCARLIEGLFRQADWPQGLATMVLASNETSAKLIGHPAVQGVALTGSTAAGQAVAATAGRQVKKVILELGGSDPYLILEDADLEKAAHVCAASRMIAGGQCCISAKRLIVLPQVRQEFERLLIAAMENFVLGDPFEAGVTLGPMCRPDLRTTLHRQVTDSLTQGARLVLGGAIPDGPGNYYPATVVTDVQAGMPLADEEVFGPVAVLMEAPDLESAITLANQTNYGLGAGIFTQNLALAQELATRRLEAGSVVVNTFVRSDPRLPFGGIKDSGLGRELGSLGIREFTNPKSVWVA